MNDQMVGCQHWVAEAANPLTSIFAGLQLATRSFGSHRPHCGAGKDLGYLTRCWSGRYRNASTGSRPANAEIQERRRTKVRSCCPASALRNSSASAPEKNCRPRGTRTPNPRIKSPLLYHLSYRPKPHCTNRRAPHKHTDRCYSSPGFPRGPPASIVEG